MTLDAHGIGTTIDPPSDRLADLENTAIAEVDFPTNGGRDKVVS
jgi:hypothetical protein